MSKTFFISASSEQSSVTRCKELCQRLEDAGMTCLVKWWDDLGKPETEWPSLASKDINGAVGCDVFILLADTPSYGACVELGARLASGKKAYVVGEGHALFTSHPLVCRFSVDSLLAHLGARDGESAV